jgi:hypothetical protein
MNDHDPAEKLTVEQRQRAEHQRTLARGEISPGRPEEDPPEVRQLTPSNVLRLVAVLLFGLDAANDWPFFGFVAIALLIAVVVLSWLLAVALIFVVAIGAGVFTISLMYTAVRSWAPRIWRTVRQLPPPTPPACIHPRLLARWDRFEDADNPDLITHYICATCGISLPRQDRLTI